MGEASAAPAVSIPPLDDYDYQVQRFIETDSKMSSVLLAVTAQQRPVVLKIARVDQRARAEVNREAIQNSVLWLQRLGAHAGLVQLYPIAYKRSSSERARKDEPVFCATLRQWAGEPEFLVMEYLEGGSLREVVGAHPLSLDVTLWIAHQLAASLDYVHQQGCVHRDIKPENILFRGPPPGRERDAKTTGQQLDQIRPVLVDFGVAAGRGEHRLVSGSRLWMAPELQEAYEQSPLPVDPAWDVYALGLILCYMISGRRPRRRSYEYASVLAYREHTIALLQRELDNHGGEVSVQERLAQLITAMLAKDPTDRPAAHEVAAKAATLLADRGVTLTRPTRLRMLLARGRDLPPRKRLQLALIAALVVGVVLGGLAGLLISLPATVNAGDGSDRPAAPAGEIQAQGHTRETATPPQLGEITPTPARQPVLLQSRNTPAAALSPEPTRVVLSPTPTLPPPTLVPLALPLTQPPPTLVPFTPVPTVGVSKAPPAAAVLPPAAPLPTRQLPRPSPSTTPAVNAAASRKLTPVVQVAQPSAQAGIPALEQVQLVAPESGTVSDQGKVEFSWQAGASALAADHCFELVFWDPKNGADKRSPTGASRSQRQRVDFTLLFNSSDPLLRALTQSEEEFNWGVRIVACSAPRTVLQDVQQVRIYSYKGK
ncbi:MAG: protein kinase [Caldilineaceae bacterium]